MMKLLTPKYAYKKSFIEMVNDFLIHDYVNYIKYSKAISDFDSYYKELLLKEKENICITRWLQVNNNIVGVVRIRPNLNTEFLKTEAGNIGYDIAPNYRNLGYGKAILKLSSKICKNHLNMKHMVVISEEKNLASIAIIKSMNGLLIEKRESVDYGLTNLIYSITL